MNTKINRCIAVKLNKKLKDEDSKGMINNNLRMGKRIKIQKYFNLKKQGKQFGLK